MAGFTPPSLLVIIPVSGNSHFELTPFSARGLSQTLEQITSITGQGTPLGKLFRRDVNGTLVNLSYPQFQKYQSVVTCKDTETPCFDGAWMGAVVDVQCAAELNFVTGSQLPQRSVVSGSERHRGHLYLLPPAFDDDGRGH